MPSFPTLPTTTAGAVGITGQIIGGLILVITPGNIGYDSCYDVIYCNGNAVYSEGQNEDPGDKDPSTPVGRRGNPIKVKPGTNKPATIGGRVYTGHAIDRMQGRGVPPSAVEDAILNGTQSPGHNPGETVHSGSNGVTVVTGSGGQVVTVIPK